MSLDPDQIKAVESTANRTFVIAGAGSGKTKTIIARIKHILVTTDPRKVVAITYTNSEASEIQKRLGPVRLGYLGTLHGWCFRMLQKHGSLIGYRASGVNLIDEDTSTKMLQDAADRVRFKGSWKELKEGDSRMAKLARSEHEQVLKRNNLIDYDTVLTDGAELLKHHQVNIVELVADEAQDFALIDWQIFEAMNARRWFIVGDSDQGIFSFRGADPRQFMLAAELADSIITLERNYRSDRRICAAATALIRHNTGRFDKATVANSRDEGDIVYTTFETDGAEQSTIAFEINEELKRGTMASEIAVLLRTNAMVKEFREKLAASGVPVSMVHSTKRPDDLGTAMTILNFFADPLSDALAKRVMLLYASTTLPFLRAKELSLASGNALYVEAGLTIPSKFQDIPQMLHNYGVSKESVEFIQERIAQLPDPDLASLRHDLFTLGRTEPEKQTPGVTVTTMHGAKGREWDVVFLPAWEEGVIPPARKDTNIEEEHRIAFVAITRARHALYVSSAKVRSFQWSQNVPMAPSRFIEEAFL